LNGFVAHPSWQGGHAQTIYGWANPRYFPRLPKPTLRYFDVDHDARVVAHCHWHPKPWRHPTILALHGLNGSSDAHYMRGIALKAFEQGMNVVRLNQRNCGNTEHLAAGLFHSGLTWDARRVVEELATVDGIEAIAVAGYSLGGNLALKLAGEYGDEPPPALRAVCAVSPIIEISPCVAALEHRRNFLYQWNFVKDLKRRMRRKARAWPGRFDVSLLARIRTVRDFDEAYTAPYFGFADAEDYYYRASAMRVADRIRVPALIVTAADDPFVPLQPFRDPKIAANPSITLLACEHGGHCGFIAQPAGEDDGYWAERQIVDFASAHLTSEAAPQTSEHAEPAAASPR
jgi:predicted alpha/beta-fold hydrolase